MDVIQVNDGDHYFILRAYTGVPEDVVASRELKDKYGLAAHAAAQTYTIEAPNLIWVVRNEQGELVAIEISDGRDREFIGCFV